MRGSLVNLFYLPALVILVAFMIYPLLSGIGLSMTNWDGYNAEKPFVGLANYAHMFTDGNFLTVVVNTLIYGIGSTIIQQILGLALALLLNTRIKGKSVIRAIIYLPALGAPGALSIMHDVISHNQQ
ncbi:carbohydrate ABC transporter permease, partial [Bifidobacterium xylocopae]